MPDLMIFAAGKGTRMAPLTDVTPKPLIRVGGQTLLDRAVTLGRQGGAGRIVVNTHHLGEQVVAHLAGSDVAISDESDLLRETGGGLRHAAPLLAPGPVITLNPDVVWTGPNPVAALLANWRDDMEALLALVPLARARGRVGGGDFALDAAGRISRKGDWVYAGAQIVRPERLAEIGEEVFSLNRLWDMMIAGGGAYGLVHAGGWCDVGRPENIAEAEAQLSDGA